MSKHLRKKSRFSVRMQNDDWSFSLSTIVCVSIGFILTVVLLNLHFWFLGE